MDEKGRKRVVLGIVLVVVGLLVTLVAYYDAMNNRELLYDSHYTVPTGDAVAFILGIVVMIIGFAILAHLYIKGGVSGKKVNARPNSQA